MSRSSLTTWRGLRRGARRMASPASHQARSPTRRTNATRLLSVVSPYGRLFSASSWMSLSRCHITSSFMYGFILDLLTS
ncbi:MAG: hypothetical protein E6J06_14460 [Chloroflexi bacterium]|nr:MAG: hypothetical protein E6J06_14460 [Chloroflexota bacterium]